MLLECVFARPNYLSVNLIRTMLKCQEFVVKYMVDAVDAPSGSCFGCMI